MVAARQGNNMKRKNMNNKGGNGNMRKNFKQGQQQNNGGFKQGMVRNNRGGNMGHMNQNAMFQQMADNINQMIDNPGYMDFNEPSGRNFMPINKNLPIANNGMNNQNGGAGGNKNKQNRGGGGGGGRRMNFKQNTNMNNPRNNINNNGPRNGGMGNGNMNIGNGRFNPVRNNQIGGNFGMNGNMKNNGNLPFRNGMGRMNPMNNMGNGMRPNDFDNFGGPQFYPQRFNPGPMMPPPPQMMRPPMGRPGPMGRRPLPPGPMPPFRVNNNNNNNRGPIRRKVAGGNRRGGAGANQKGGVKNRRKIGKKNNQNIEKYPLNKPWVTDEIKAAHDKKVELSNQLKGKKDDELFAEFKKQRDAFVSMYETAKQEFNKQKQQVIYIDDHFIHKFIKSLEFSFVYS